MAVPPVPPLLAVVLGLGEEHARTTRVRASTRIFMLTFLPCFTVYTY
jgi:hypothetical protein